VVKPEKGRGMCKNQVFSAGKKRLFHLEGKEI